MLINKNKLKKKIISHTFKNGKKHVCEKIFKKSFKSLQKIQKKSHNDVITQSILNVTPTFRIIKLKRRKSKLEIPVFLSSYIYRTSWALKYLIKLSKSNNIFYKQLEQEILFSAKSNGEIVKFKEELHKNISQKKKYFKFYRW